MNHITGMHRHQTYFATLDDQVSADNAVRLMDAFVDKLDHPKWQSRFGGGWFLLYNSCMILSKLYAAFDAINIVYIWESS